MLHRNPQLTCMLLPYPRFSDILSSLNILSSHYFNCQFNILLCILELGVLACGELTSTNYYGKLLNPSHCSQPWGRVRTQVSHTKIKFHVKWSVGNQSPSVLGSLPRSHNTVSVPLFVKQIFFKHQGFRAHIPSCDIINYMTKRKFAPCFSF